jgi:lysophospholipase L1-like esterase
VLARLPIVASFDWRMPDRFGLDVNQNDRMDLPNTVEYVQNVTGAVPPAGTPAAFSVTFDASRSRSNTGAVRSYSWTITGGRLTQPLQHTASVPTWTVNLPEAAYQVSLTVDDGTNPPHSAARLVPVEDFLIVSIGDSYSSGEGNPERRRGQMLKSPHYDPNRSGVLWADDGTTSGTTSVAQDHYRSHRTTVGWPAQVALALERADPRTSVTFVSLAASGATVAAGLTGPYAGVSNEQLSSTLPPMPAQLQEARRLVGSRRIDALLVSIGANDAGFANVIKSFTVADPVHHVRTYDQLVSEIISNSKTGRWPNEPLAGTLGLPRQLGRVAQAATSMRVFNTYLVGYGDPTGRIRGGTLEYCPDILHEVAPTKEIDSAEQEKLVNRLLRPLNAILRNSARSHGWSFVPQDDFANGHGYCAASPTYQNAPDAYDFYIGNTFPADLPRPTDPNLSWFRTLSQAAVAQGPLQTPVIRPGNPLLPQGLDTVVRTKGVLHPNEFGHQSIRDQVLNNLYLPVPAPGFFDDWDDILAEATETRRQSNATLRTVKRNNAGQMVETPFYETIFPPSDVDMFKVDISRNERLEIRGALVDTGHTAAVRVFAADGTPIHSLTMTERGPVACAACSRSFLVSGAGPIYIGVSGFTNQLYDPTTGLGDESGGSSFSYELMLATVDGQPDNTIAAAVPVQRAASSIAGFAVETVKDVDMFRIEGNTGERVTISLQVPTGSRLSPQIRLHRADGTEISRHASTVTYTFASAGTVFLAVSSSNTTYDANVGVATPDTSSIVAARGGAGAVARVPLTTGAYTLSISRQ